MAAAITQFQMQCIFCGETPCTREHYWPEWCHKERVFDELAPVINRADILIKVDDKGERVVERRVKQSGRRRIDDVAFRACDPCNSGWMGTLQNVTIPSLRPLVRGEATVTTPEEFPNLAAWATMTTMVIDALHRSAISVADRKAFMETRTPPTSWRIWVGQAHDRRWNALYKIRPLVDATTKYTGGFVMNFCLGRAAFVITNEVDLSPVTQHNMWVEGMRSIHPAPIQSEIDWRKIDRLLFVTLEQMDKALEAAVLNAIIASHQPQ